MGEDAAKAARLEGERRPLGVARDGAGLEWHGAGHRHRKRGRRWRRILWALLLPPRGPRMGLTLPGALLVALALAIGGAAYNTSNNILFITLSLLLSCLLLSGVLAWLNFSRLRWRLRVRLPLRKGMEHSLMVEVRNDKQFAPAYALAFECAATGGAGPVMVALPGRLDPGAQASAEWRLRPARRGLLRVELVAAVSVFPFGFVRKVVGIGQGQEVPVWPAAVAYQTCHNPPGWRPRAGARRGTAGPRGGDLRALRRYAPGDPPRAVHWKASARARRLLVREFSPELDDGVLLSLQPPAERWPRAEQFELLCGLAATLAEDLFHAGRLRATVIGDGPVQPVRGARDVEAFLDQIARLEPAPGPARPEPSGGPRPGLMTFAPDGARGVIAYVDGIKTATA